MQGLRVGGSYEGTRERLVEVYEQKWSSSKDRE